MTIKVIVTVPVNVDSASVIEAIRETLTANGTIANGVEIEFTTPRLSKSDKVILQMAEIVASGTYIDRNEIAKAVECTVSLISATIKENVELKEDANAKDISDHNTVTAFLAMEKNAKATKKAMTQQKNMLRNLEALQKQGVDIAALLQFPTMGNVESAPENAETADVTPIKKATPRSKATNA